MVGLLLCVVCFCGGLVVVCGVAVVGVVCSLPLKLWWVLVSWLSELLGLAVSQGCRHLTVQELLRRKT